MAGKRRPRRWLRRLQKAAYRSLDAAFVPVDKRLVRRTRNLRLIPAAADRRGGKLSYAEWAHVIGIFQTLIHLHAPRSSGNTVLDVGTGTGLVAIAAEPCLGSDGELVGVDVGARDIAFCRRHYPADRFSFHHVETANPVYAPDQPRARAGWPVADGTVDLVTALSVWTHLAEADALALLGDVDRVLRPGGRAIVTLFLLDGAYEQSLAIREAGPGRYHATLQQDWVFDTPAYGSDAWFGRAADDVPEEAIAVTEDGVARMLAGTSLREVARYPGNWKEAPGLYFQDVLVLEKARRVGEP